MAGPYGSSGFGSGGYEGGPHGGQRFNRGRDGDHVRERLFEHFKKLPNLQFGGDSTETITYKFPTLSKPTVRRMRLMDRASSPNLHESLRSVFTYLLTGTDKLKYGKTSDEEWRRYMRFPCDRLPRSADGQYQRAAPLKPPPGVDVVNATPETARTWFRDRLIPKIHGNKRVQIYLVGDPGAGKSTLMKYLINTNHDYARDEFVIFSRFEYLKFSKYWWTKGRDLSEALDHYLSFIILRDTIYFNGYERDRNGAYHRMEVSRIAGERLDHLCASVRRDLGDLGHRGDQWRSDFRAAMTTEGVDTGRLRDIPHMARVAILGQLDRMDPAYRSNLCLILDGLDCIAIEDFAFDTKKYELLKHIMERRTALTTFKLFDHERTIRATPMFVMRENTFDRFMSDHEIDIAENMVCHVDAIDPEVTILNAIVRATDAWANDLRRTRDGVLATGIAGLRLERAETRAERLRMRNNIVQSLMLTLRIINQTAKIGRGRRAVYELFGSNIRTLFEFMQKVFMTFIDDAIDTGELEIRTNSTPDEILRILDSEAGRRLIRTKRYRLIELLLFSYLPWYENAISYRSDDDDDYDDGGGSEDAPKQFWDNRQYTGVIDNIFNYATAKHSNHPDLHCLLEKVRIIQAITRLQPSVGLLVGAFADEAALVVYPTQRQIRDTMARLSGYVPSDLDHSLHALMRTEMITAHIAANGRRGYRVTPRGRAVVNVLARDMSYIEHVFHGTLLPEALVKGIRDDRRAVNIDLWTAASIRNVFIWLAYLKFVEDNPANGVVVRRDLRLSEDSMKRTLRSLERILEPSRDPERRTNQLQVTKNAVRHIDNLVNRWRVDGLIRSDPASPPPPPPPPHQAMA